MNDSKFKTQHSKFIALLLIYLALAAIYSVVTPLGEGPDEPGHAAYVFFLAREARLPDQRANEVPGEGHQPPLAYALAAPLAAWLPAEQRGLDLPGNPRFVWAGGSEPNAVAHGSREYWPWAGAVLAWHLARLVSVGLGAATVVLTYSTARALIGQRRMTNDGGTEPSFVFRPSSFVPPTAAAVVALNPQFLFTSGLVTNDALLTALSALLLWLVLRPTAGERLALRTTIVHASVLGLVLGLALLAKQSALMLVPVALLGAARPGRQSLGRAVAGGLVALAVAALVCGWWYWRNLALYGDPLGLAVFQAEFAGQPFDPGSLAAWRGALAQLHGSFWARFGWMNVPPPGWVIGLFTAIELLALAGWLWRLIGSRQKIEDGRSTIEDRAVGQMTSDPRSSLLCRELLMNGWWALVALPALALAWLLSFALTAGLVAWQGRLLFPALPAIAILLACGLASWQNRESRTKNHVWRTSVWFLVLSCWFCLVLWLPLGVIATAYPRQTLPEQAALAQLGTPVFGRLGLRGEPGAELRGWRLDGELRPGGAAELTLTWHALGRQNRDWTVFVHLVGASEQIVAQSNAQPRAGAFPMSQWVAGDWLHDQHAIALPAELVPGSYELRVGLYDTRTGRRTGVFSQRGTLRGDYLALGQVEVVR